MVITSKSQERLETLPLALAMAVLVVVLLRTAWLCDDAYISFRTIDNCLNGYGLRWNIAERVQAYTHPLWLLLVMGIRALSGEYYFSVITFSILLSGATALIVAWTIAESAKAAIVATLALVCSKAFVDFSTSGLENPLAHLLLAAFMGAYYSRAACAGQHRLLLMSALAALLACTRLDLLLLCIPGLCSAARCQRRDTGSWRAVAQALMFGFAPLLAWELFAVVYYGFPFPNTAYAKLVTGIPRWELLVQGLYYLLSCTASDPASMVILLAGLTLGIGSKDRRDQILALGTVTYLVYVVFVGGDFMVGRFLSSPVLACIVLLCRSDRMATWWLPACAVLLITSLSSSGSPLRSGGDYGDVRGHIIDARGVADERAYYYPFSGLLHAARGGSLPYNNQVKEALADRQAGERVVVRKNVGYYAFFAGPGVHVVDLRALTDPLLARLPGDTALGWRIGHFDRVLPAGYIESLRAARNHIEDPAVAEYYDRLRLVTQGALFDTARWRQIWYLNTSNGPEPRTSAGPLSGAANNNVRSRFNSFTLNFR